MVPAALGITFGPNSSIPYLVAPKDISIAAGNYVAAHSPVFRLYKESSLRSSILALRTGCMINSFLKRNAGLKYFGQTYSRNPESRGIQSPADSTQWALRILNRK